MLIDMVSKLYDDFSKAKETMVEQINDNILTEKNVDELYNKELSERAGVPVYYLTGQKFKCLVRNIGVFKGFILNESNLDFRTDGSSFSIDGSELLQVFGNSSDYYTLAYSSIPSKQLVHAYPTDSFSRYDRTYKDDIPQNLDATDRVMGLYTPEQFVTMGEECNEFVISVPNRWKQNELEEKLEKPNAFAIYCYDQICDTDILSAKNLGVGIILVNTKCYSIDRSNRLSQRDTILVSFYSIPKAILLKFSE